MALTLVSVNIEGDRHLEAVARLVERVRPDVLCLQELFEDDIPFFTSIAGLEQHAFVPLLITSRHVPPVRRGNAIYSRLSLDHITTSFFHGSEPTHVLYDESDVSTKRATESYAYLGATVIKAGNSFRIGTTHFTWTPDGKPSNEQRQDLKKLLAVLEKEDEVVFCGDFNAPRGGEIFSAIAARYTDNIPASYATSLDANLHRVGPATFISEGMDAYMVDGLFTTPGYRATDVRLEFGVSDHAAIVATIEHT